MKKSPVIGFALFLCLSLPLWAQEKSPSQSGGRINATGGGPSQCDIDPGDVLIDNCGFETGDFSGWTQSGSLDGTYVDQACHLSGQYGACITSKDLSFISQLIPTTPGEFYDLRFGLRNHGQPNRFQVYWGGQLIYDKTDLPDFSTASDSLPGSEAFSRLFAASDVTQLKFGFFNPTSGTFFLDDIWAWQTSRRPEVSCEVHEPAQDCPNLFDGVDVGSGGGAGQYAIQISYGSCAPCGTIIQWCTHLPYRVEWADQARTRLQLTRQGLGFVTFSPGIAVVNTETKPNWARFIKVTLYCGGAGPRDGLQPQVAYYTISP